MKDDTAVPVMLMLYIIGGFSANILLFLNSMSQTENLVTVMWASEQFDANNPDTFYEEV